VPGICEVHSFKGTFPDHGVQTVFVWHVAKAQHTSEINEKTCFAFLARYGTLTRGSIKDCLLLTTEQPGSPRQTSNSKTQSMAQMLKSAGIQRHALLNSYLLPGGIRMQAPQAPGWLAWPKYQPLQAFFCLSIRS